MAETMTESEILDEIVRRIVEVADPDKIILFGSRARGEAGEGSDYDILVISPTTQGFWKRTVPIYYALEGIPASCDVLWRTPQEVEQWRAVKAHFLARATREGMVIHERAA